MGLVDFTNPRAVVWFKEKLRGLLRMGVDCFKTDFGERIPIDVVYHDGSDPERMHNYYTYLYNKTVFELLEEERGAQPGPALRAIRHGRQPEISRALGRGLFGHLRVDGGDAARRSLARPLGLRILEPRHLGFEKTATPDLYKRWVAFGLLSSHCRLHGNESYRVPWLFDEEAMEVLRFFAKLKSRLMPYIFSAAVEASRDGLPMMRAMVLEFPDGSGLRISRSAVHSRPLPARRARILGRRDVSYYLPPAAGPTFSAQCRWKEAVAEESTTT